MYLFVIAIASILVFVSLYKISMKGSIQKIIGVIILGNAINLLVLSSGMFMSTNPAFKTITTTLTSNSLVQALILTAIVIGLGVFLILFVLHKKKI